MNECVSADEAKRLTLGIKESSSLLFINKRILESIFHGHFSVSFMKNTISEVQLEKLRNLGFVTLEDQYDYEVSWGNES